VVQTSVFVLGEEEPPVAKPTSFSYFFLRIDGWVLSLLQWSFRV